VTPTSDESGHKENVADAVLDEEEALRSRLREAASELSQDLHRSPRPSEVAERAETDVDEVVESVAWQGPLDG
jgi:hypothetical protein